MARIIGGIKGGVTQSHLVLLDLNGNVIAKTDGPGTNHHLTGMKECRKRIAELVDKAKISAGISIDTPLYAMGLGLSGCEDNGTNQELVDGLLEDYPRLAEKYVIRCDTEGCIAVTSNRGGIACIAGSGASALLINPDGTIVKSGGWGYLLGDEGSAWKISLRAIKYCFDKLDNFVEPPFPNEKMWELIKDHFHIETQPEILTSFYKNFDKGYIATLSKKLGDLAREGDKLSLTIFKEAGTHLARRIAVIVPKADPALAKEVGGVHVLCVGSVWQSWDLLRSGFIDWIENKTSIKEMSLMRSTVDMGTGAAFMAADHLDISLKRDYSKNTEVFYHFNRNIKE